MNNGWGRFVDVKQMLRKYIFALVGIAATLPSMVAAKDQLVIIAEFGFFPQVSYVKPGDLVHFENTSGVQHELVGTRNGNHEWTVTVPADTTVTLTVVGSFGQLYNSTLETMNAAELSFDEPPEAALAD